MNIEEFKKNAIEFLNDSSMVVNNVMETKDSYLFFFDYPNTDEPTPSSPIVLVNKENRKTELLMIPSKEGFAILDEAEEIKTW